MARDKEEALRLIKELTEQIAKAAMPPPEPWWAWFTIHWLADDALGLCEVSPVGMEWAIAKAQELGPALVGQATNVRDFIMEAECPSDVRIVGKK